MTAGIEVRNAWESRVWSDPAVLILTDRIFMFDVTEDSQFDALKLIHEQRINFFTCQVLRSSVPLIGGSVRYSFRVQVRYFLQQTDEAESTYNAVADRLELVDQLVLTTLGKTWGGTVDYYDGAVPQDVVKVTVDDKECWRGGYTYSGFKTV